MKRTAWMVAAMVCCVAVGVVSVAADPHRVLVVDGTKSLEATLRVGGLVSAIRQSGLAEVSVLFTDAVSPYADSLAGKPLPATPYDLIIVIPQGVGDGTADMVWLLAAGNLAADPGASSAVALLNSGMGLVFGGAIRAVTALDDLWALFTSALYVAQGWLR